MVDVADGSAGGVTPSHRVRVTGVISTPFLREGETVVVEDTPTVRELQADRLIMVEEVDGGGS